jgi:hypothetical protein
MESECSFSDGSSFNSNAVDLAIAIQLNNNVSLSTSTSASTSVTARTKCYSIEGSFVDCTIEDTKLQKEEKEGRGES